MRAHGLGVEMGFSVTFECPAVRQYDTASHPRAGEIRVHCAVQYLPPFEVSSSGLGLIVGCCRMENNKKIARYGGHIFASARPSSFHIRNHLLRRTCQYVLSKPSINPKLDHVIHKELKVWSFLVEQPARRYRALSQNLVA